MSYVQCVQISRQFIKQQGMGTLVDVTGSASNEMSFNDILLGLILVLEAFIVSGTL